MALVSRREGWIDGPEGIAGAEASAAEALAASAARHFCAAALLAGCVGLGVGTGVGAGSGGRHEDRLANLLPNLPRG